MSEVELASGLPPISQGDFVTKMMEEGKGSEGKVDYHGRDVTPLSATMASTSTNPQSTAGTTGGVAGSGPLRNRRGQEDYEAFLRTPLSNCERCEGCFYLTLCVVGFTAMGVFIDLAKKNPENDGYVFGAIFGGCLGVCASLFTRCVCCPNPRKWDDCLHGGLSILAR